MRHLYIAVRADLPLPQQAVQACHAAIQSARDLIQADEIHPSLVILTVPNLPALIDLSCRLTNRGIAHRVFQEEDMGGQVTALATEPVEKEQRRIFQKMKLYHATSA
jgi:peptidyl-tRNA hydrolase